MNTRRCINYLSIVLLLLAAWQGGHAAYIFAKAELAQVLMARAWHASDGGVNRVRPWRGADATPVARLMMPALKREFYVLSEASARNLAFGPAHVPFSGWPADGGVTALAGHRDTHFAEVKKLAPGSPLRLEHGHKEYRYRVTGARVLHESETAELIAGESPALLLVTCYPFDSAEAGTPWRYVVYAEPIPAVASVTRALTYHGANKVIGEGVAAAES